MGPQLQRLHETQVELLLCHTTRSHPQPSCLAGPRPAAQCRARAALSLPPPAPHQAQARARGRALRGPAGGGAPALSRCHGALSTSPTLACKSCVGVIVINAGVCVDTT